MSDSFTPQDAAADGPSSASAAPASWWEDYIDIFYTPSTVFARRAGSGFGVPMLVVTVLVGAIFIANSNVLQPMMDAEFARGAAAAIKKNPQITLEQMEKVRAYTEKFSKVLIFLMMPVTMFLIGLALWLVGKLVDAKQTVGAAIMVAAFAYVPKILEAVLSGVQGLLLDPASLNGRYRLTLGAGRFLDPDTASPLLLALVGRIDLFTIWVTVLLAIGLSVTGKIPRQKAAIAAVIVWILGALPGVLGALRS